jgi:hypothetical protein
MRASEVLVSVLAHVRSVLHAGDVATVEALSIAPRLVGVAIDECRRAYKECIVGWCTWFVKQAELTSRP